jgi:hypothetical protein
VAGLLDPTLTSGAPPVVAPPTVTPFDCAL